MKIAITAPKERGLKQATVHCRGGKEARHVPTFLLVIKTTKWFTTLTANC